MRGSTSYRSASGRTEAGISPLPGAALFSPAGARHNRGVKRLQSLLALLVLGTANAAPQVLLDAGDYARAYEVALTERDPLSASQAAAAQLSYRAPGERAWAERAVAAGREATRQRPQEAGAHLALGQALGLQARLGGYSLRALGQAREARRELERALSLDPALHRARMALGYWHALGWAKAGRLSGADRNEALRLTAQAIGAAPLDLPLNVQAGQAYAALKDPRAAGVLRRALTLNAKTAPERDAQAQARALLAGSGSPNP